MRARSKAFKVTRLKLSEAVTDTKVRMELEMTFAEFEAARQVAVERHRKAVVAQADSQQAQMDMQKAHQKLLLKVSEHSTQVASEPVWYVFRSNSDIILESPFGERTQRNLVRAQLQQLDAQVRNNESDDDRDLYEEDDDNGSNNSSSGASGAN